MPCCNKNKIYFKNQVKKAMYALLIWTEVWYKYFTRFFKSVGNLNSMESFSSTPVCYRNHLQWSIAEKDALATCPNSFLPLSTPPVLHIPVFDYTSLHCSQINCCGCCFFKGKYFILFSDIFSLTGSSIQPSILGKK